MIPFPGGARVWLATGRTDMRKGMNGLALQVQQVLERERAEHGQPPPAPPLHLTGGALTPGRAGVGSGHPGVDAALIQEHQAPGLDPGQLGPPRGPRLGQLRPLLLRGAQRLFCARARAS